jgi:hypothetical protein
VFLSEFGWPDQYDGNYIARTIDSVTSRVWVGWDVYAFNGGNVGTFNLIRDNSLTPDPTPAGMAVAARMLNG